METIKKKTNESSRTQTYNARNEFIPSMGLSRLDRTEQRISELEDNQ